MRELSHRAAFEQHGETYVRMLAEQSDSVGKEARAWLGEQQALRGEAAAKLRDEREEKTLRLAETANEIAARSAASAEKSMKVARVAAYVSAGSLLLAGLIAIVS